MLIQTVPPALLGVPQELAVAHWTFNLLMQFWLHTALLPPLPWVELVLNTPSLHRVHHGRNLLALGKNYGAVLSVWDRLGGTFEPEERVLRDEGPMMYGVVPPLQSWDPVWANLHHWHHLLFVQTRWHGLTAPFRHWTPPRARCPALGSRMNPWGKFDLSPRGPVAAGYAAVEFSLALGAGLFFTVSEAQTPSACRGFLCGLPRVLQLCPFALVLWQLRGAAAALGRVRLPEEALRAAAVTGALAAAGLPAAAAGYGAAQAALLLLLRREARGAPAADRRDRTGKTWYTRATSGGSGFATGEAHEVALPAREETFAVRARPKRWARVISAPLGESIRVRFQ